MKNSTWLNILAFSTLLIGAALVFLSTGGGYAFVMSAVFTTGAAICKSVEKQKL